MNRENFHQVKTQFHEHFPRGNFLLVERKFPPNFSSSPTHLKMRFLSTFVKFSELCFEIFKAFNGQTYFLSFLWLGSLL